MKRSIAAALIVLLVLSLCACRNTEVITSSFGSDYIPKPKKESQEAVSQSEENQTVVSSRPQVSSQTSFFDTTNQAYMSENNDPTTLVYTEPAEPSRVINVKDFGATGDGVTDDRAAIFAAFEEAAKNLPATVYFPQGEYTLHTGGVYIKLPLGADGLTVKGDGGDRSIIKYSPDWSTNGTWVALRIQPQRTPSNTDEYLKNITIKDIGVYDTDPVKHAWNTAKGDASTEETHGLDIQHCIGAVIKNCKINNVGDEAIDMVYCINSTIIGNTVINSPGAGAAGGAISVGDGSQNVLIVNNTVDGSIKGKKNFGIAIEALHSSVQNIEIKNNTVSDIEGNGVNIGAPDGKIENVILYNNTITNCINGINFLGSGTKSNVKIVKTAISTVKVGMFVDGAKTEGLSLENFSIESATTRGIYIKEGKNVVVKNGVLTNLNQDAIWNAGDNTLVQNVKIDGVGLATDKYPAINQYHKGGYSAIENITIKNCKTKTAIKNVPSLTAVSVDQPQQTGYYSVQGASKINGGFFSRHIVGLKAGAVIDGAVVTLSSNVGSTPAIYLTVSNCVVKNCTVTVQSGKAIGESKTADSNQVLNNTCIGGSTSKLGANSVFRDNTEI